MTCLPLLLLLELFFMTSKFIMTTQWLINDNTVVGLWCNNIVLAQAMVFLLIQLTISKKMVYDITIDYNITMVDL